MKTKWRMPESFPDLSAADIIAIDIETRDDDLKAKGPGVRRGGYIVGIAIGTPDGFRGYYPVAHDEGQNLNKHRVFSWLDDQLKNNQIKIGANILYDIDYLTAAGITVGGRWYDIQVAEPLIDENKQGRYNLDALAFHYLNERKDISVLEDECKRRGFRGKPQNHLWKLPATFVGAYAESDVDLPLRIFEKQKQILMKEGTWDLFLMETRLLPMLLHMRKVGVRIDTTQLTKTIRSFSKRLYGRKKKLVSIAGSDVSYWAAASLAQAFDRLGLSYPRTPKTKAPSFTKPWLASHDHPIAELILECRSLDKLIGTFLTGQLQGYMIDDRIHCLFNPFKSDDYGTVTGRFSSSNPNLQFIPSRDPELGPLCRSMFIPDEDHIWARLDYSQIEFRIFAHYAMGKGAEEFRRAYNINPFIDYHQWCADEAQITRRAAKTTNFSVIYGVGRKALAARLELSLKATDEFLELYHSKLPFAKNTLRIASDRANRRGWIKTILNRRRRFIKWEAADWDLSKKYPAVYARGGMLDTVKEEIRQAIKNKKPVPRPGVRRAGTYKALNALIQGSAADLMKKAMVDAWESGVFGDGLLIPHLTVHDELDTSVPPTDIGYEALVELKHIMENAIPFKIPVVVDVSTGKNWGSQEDIKW